MAIESKKELKILAVNSVGGFLKSLYRNVRFVGLTTLQRIAITDPDLIIRHKELINTCMLDNDDTIKKRSIELLFTFLNNEDSVNIVESIMNNIDKYSHEMKRFATSFIVSAIEKNSPSKDWMIDQFLKLMQHVK